MNVHAGVTSMMESRQRKFSQRAGVMNRRSCALFGDSSSMLNRVRLYREMESICEPGRIANLTNDRVGFSPTLVA